MSVQSCQDRLHPGLGYSLFPTGLLLCCWGAFHPYDRKPNISNTKKKIQIKKCKKKKKKFYIYK